LASIEDGSRDGLFSIGLFDNGETWSEQLGLCILDKVGALTREEVAPHLPELLEDLAACCSGCTDEQRAICVDKLAVGYSLLRQFTFRDPQELCNDPREGENCTFGIGWVKEDGMPKHPDWFTPWGLFSNSTDEEVQAYLWLRGKSGCQRPCGHVHIRSGDLLAAASGHLLGSARHLLKHAKGMNEQAKELLGKCANFPNAAPCASEFGIDGSALFA